MTAIAATFLGGYDSSEFAKRMEIAGDYGEAFNYQANEPNLAVLPILRKTTVRFRDLAARGESPLERGRIEYFAGFVGFIVPYCDAYELAHKFDDVLKRAVDLRTAGKEDEGRKEVLETGVPLWPTIAPLVR